MTLTFYFKISKSESEILPGRWMRQESELNKEETIGVHFFNPAHHKSSRGLQTLLSALPIALHKKDGGEMGIKGYIVQNCSHAASGSCVLNIFET